MQPINLILGATVLGLLVAPFYSVSVVVSVFLAGAAILSWFFFRKYSIAFPVLLFFLVSMISNLRYPAQFQHNDDIEQLDLLNKRICWQGEVLSVAAQPEGHRSIDVLLRSVEDIQGAITGVGVRLYAGAGNGRIFLPGDLIRVCSRLRRPRLFGTPGEFHWPRYLLSQGLDLTAWVKSVDEIEVSRSAGHVVERSLESFRYAVGCFVDRHLNSLQAPLVRALILGEGSIIPADIRKMLGRSGISHLFAISGLHVGLLGLYLYWCLLPVWKVFPCLADRHPPQRIIPILIIPFLLCFLVFTGGSLATQRASFVAGVGALALLRRYHINALQLLASAATIFLLADPLVLWNAGWQLSFIGAAAIVYVRPVMQRLPVNGIAAYLVRLFFVSLTATLATTPLVMANFHMFVPLGALVNLIAVPLVTLLALPIGLLGVVSYCMWEPLSDLCLRLSGMILQFLVHLCQWVDSRGWLCGMAVFPSRGQVLACAVVVLITFLLMKFHTRRAVACCVMSLVLACFVWHCNELSVDGPAVTLISVGQGEAILLQDGAGNAVLVDGGGLYSDTFDVGERLVAPALGLLGVRSLSAVVLTHNHPDHSKGLPFILENFPVNTFYASEDPGQLSPLLSAMLKFRDIPQVRPDPGWSDIPFGNTVIQLFAPGYVGYPQNDGSLVAYWPFGDGQGVLLTGDLESDGVRGFMAVNKRHAAVLKLPHHGSRFSGSEALIQSVQPGICMVSAGFQNRYRLPASSLVEYIEKEGIPLLRTDLQGTVRVRLKHGEWLTERWINGLFR